MVSSSILKEFVPGYMLWVDVHLQEEPRIDLVNAKLSTVTRNWHEQDHDGRFVLSKLAPSPIDRLPSELLLLIFKFSFMTCRVGMGLSCRCENFIFLSDSDEDSNQSRVVFNDLN
jgi:hypothetical protein